MSRLFRIVFFQLGRQARSRIHVARRKTRLMRYVRSTETSIPFDHDIARVFPRPAARVVDLRTPDPFIFRAGKAFLYTKTDANLSGLDYEMIPNIFFIDFLSNCACLLFLLHAE